jgi:hypothetical protein
VRKEHGLKELSFVWQLGCCDLFYYDFLTARERAGEGEVLRSKDWVAWSICKRITFILFCFLTIKLHVHWRKIRDQT